MTKKNTLISLLILMFCIQTKAQDLVKDEIKLISVQKIIDYAFQDSQIVMMNEAHSGQKRNIRTRIIGQLVLPKAYSHGVRYLAMEALTTSFAEEANLTCKLPEENSGFSYLNQLEMRELMQLALDLGWTLVAYEANVKLEPEFESTLEEINWREKQQAKNLHGLLNTIGSKEKLLIWCGNGHLAKEPGSTPDGKFFPMGYQFWEVTGIEPFIIDQSITVDFFENSNRFENWKSYEKELKKNPYGTLGFISSTKSANVISIHNSLE
jgi:hypothetical protein